MAKEGLGLEITELRLGLPGDSYSEISVCGSKKKKRMLSDIMTSSSLDTEDENGVVSSVEDNSSPVVKSQAVGWPPVCSYRRKKNNEEASKVIGYVKVSMDGVPYLRKIDLGLSNSYNNLATVLENLFGCLGLG